MSKISRREALRNRNGGNGVTAFDFNPDKRLFVLYRAMQLELQSIMVHGSTKEDQTAKANADRLWEIGDEILDLPAQTIAGVAVKIRVAITSLVAMSLNAGVEMAEDCPPIKVMSAALADAERLAGMTP